MPSRPRPALIRALLQPAGGQTVFGPRRFQTWSRVAQGTLEQFSSVARLLKKKSDENDYTNALRRDLCSFVFGLIFEEKEKSKN